MPIVCKLHGSLVMQECRDESEIYQFDFRITNSLIQSWGGGGALDLTCLDCNLTFTVFP